MKIQEALDTVLELAESAALDIKNIEATDELLLEEAHRQDKAIDLIRNMVTPKIVKTMEFLRQCDKPVKITITL